MLEELRCVGGEFGGEGELPQRRARVLLVAIACLWVTRTSFRQGMGRPCCWPIIPFEDHFLVAGLLAFMITRSIACQLLAFR